MNQLGGDRYDRNQTRMTEREKFEAVSGFRRNHFFRDAPREYGFCLVDQLVEIGPGVLPMLSFTLKTSLLKEVAQGFKVADPEIVSPVLGEQLADPFAQEAASVQIGLVL